MAKPDFTLAQAEDLVRHWLGADWQVAVGSDADDKPIAFALRGPRGEVYMGDSWRAVFRAAGVQLPLRPQYIAKGTSVMFGATAICTAPSNTLAKRIAAALNNHTPDRRGI